LKLLQEACFHLKRWKEAIAYGNRAFKYAPDGQIAMTNALAHAVQGELLPALGWLASAQRAGVTDLKDFLTSPEFDPIRQAPAFVAFQNRALPAQSNNH